MNPLFQNEPNLMPYQSEAFNNDSYVEHIFLTLKERHDIKYAIELGSCVGGTTKWLSNNFDNVITIEINPIYRDICLSRTSGSSNIESILGDTIEVLPSIINRIPEKSIWFIDSHWKNCPLLQELKIISSAGIKPVIVIHDFKVPNHPELGFDTYDGQDYSWDWIKGSIEKIYGVDGYTVSYNSEATGAMRGICYIEPKI